MSVFSAKPFFRLAFLALPCLAAAGCTSSALTDGVTLSKPSSFFATPDWMKDSGSSETSLWRPISPQDLAGPDGRCAGSDVAPVTPEGAAAGAPAADTLPTAAGIGLGMSECEVLRRAGAADNFEIGANGRGERALTLTYLHGNRPGIYRFTAGRLTSIERGPEPPPAPRVAKPKPKPAPRVAAPARPQPAPAQPQQQGSSAPWPAPQPAAQPAPAASPWPAPQQQSVPRASPWPAPQPAPQQQPASPWPAPGR